MAIKGDLLSADLSNVFQMLALNRKRGQLRVREQGNLLAKRRLFIAEDRIVLDEPPPARPLIPLMVEMGLLSYEQYVSAGSKSDRYGVDSVQILRQHGDLTKEHMDAVIQRVEEEEILEVFLWRNVSFTLEEGGEPRPESNAFSLDHLIMEAARRQDEWRHVVEPTSWRHRIHVRTTGLIDDGHAEMDSVHRIVLDHVDGVRGSREIMEVTGLPRYFVEMSLKELSETGHVVALGLLDLINTGDRLVQEGDTQDGIRLFKSALQFDRRNITIHGRLARAYLQDERIAKAAAHYRFCAMSLLKADHLDEALAIYKTVLKLLPTDFRTLERCTELLATEGKCKDKDDREVLEHSRKLLHFYLDTKQDDAALRLAEMHHTLDAEDDEVLSLVSRLRLRLGQTENAVAGYSELAQRKLEERDLQGALEIYRTIAGLDAARKDGVQARISEIQRILAGGRKRRRRNKALTVTILFGVILGAAYFGYASTAQWALEGVAEDAPHSAREAHVLSERFSEIAGWFRFTPSGSKAREKADAWKRRAVQIEKDAVISAAADLKRDQTMRTAAAAFAARGHKLLRRKETLLEARDLFRRAVTEGRKIKSGWDELPKVEKALSDIEEYLRDGERLLREGRADLASGRRREAFQKLRTVLVDYPAVPGAEAVVLPMRVLVGPPHAQITGLPGGTKSGKAELDVSPRQAVSFSVSAPGFAPQSSVIAPPAPCYVSSVVLTRQPLRSVELNEPIMHVHDLGGSQVLLLGRNGKLIWFDHGIGREVRRTAPNALQHVKARPAAGPTGLLVGSEDGLLRLVRSDGAPGWEVRPFPQCEGLADPTPLGSDFVVAARPGDVARVRSDGTVAWRHPLPAHPRHVAASGNRVAVVLRNGKLVLLDAAAGEVTKVLDGPFVGRPVVDAAGEVFATIKGTGLIRVTAPTGTPPVIAFDGKPAAGPLRWSQGVIVALDDRVIYTSAAGTRELGLQDSPVELSAGSEGLIGVRLETGRLLVLDCARELWLGSSEGERGTLCIPSVGPRRTVDAGEKGKVLVISLQ